MAVTERASVIMEQSPQRSRAAATEHPSVRGRDWHSLRPMRNRLLALIAILGVVGIFGGPLLIMMATSVTPPDEVNAGLVPRAIDLANYAAVLDQVPLLLYLQNSLVLVVFNVAAVVIVCPVVAYALSKLRWRGRGVVLLFVLSTMMLPSQVTLVPVYVLWDRLQLVGTYWPLIIPLFFGVPFYIYMLRQFFLGIPTEYIEAARLDGASEFRILFRIVVPMAKPAMVTVALFQFVATWTDFMGPLIYLRDEQLYTLSTGLYAFFSTHGTDWGPLMAACTMFTVPTFVIFLIGQRYFVEGATLGGLK